MHRDSVRLARLLPACVALLAAGAAHAGGAEYVLPENGDTVIGVVTTAFARHEDTMLDVGRRYGVGYEEIIAANPGVDPWLPGDGTEILIPTRFILPDVPREGIVVNLPEHRLYYYPPVKPGERAVVRTYPISTGKMDWKTPLGATRIVSKQERPSWYPPASVLSEHEARGDPLPKVVPPGPDNPLGEHAMRLGIPSGAYLIHGTNRPAGVGMQVTHGCIRMFPEDIAELFGLVPVNTKVNLIDQPTKLGWMRGTLYVERHPLLEGGNDPGPGEFERVKEYVAVVAARQPVDVDWDGVEHAFRTQSGVPAPVSMPRERGLRTSPAPGRFTASETAAPSSAMPH
jgi:L,D-transpeptidase ErfK/SrfK